MKETIPYRQAVGFIFTGILGTFLHFLFDLTGGSIFAALISAVNESIFEHMKLLYYPIILFAVIQYFRWGKEYRSFWCVKLFGILAGLLMIPVLYYTYTGLLGVNADWFNITIFFLAAGVTYYWETKLLQKGVSCPVPQKTTIAVLVGISLAFTVLTFFPPKIPFFQDPVTGTYGFQIS